MSPKNVTLALQGGGSHGAFTWGVLDRLLEDERIAIEGISGASAGAMNAVALAHGYAQGGRDGARQALKNFWDSVAASSPLSTIPHDLSTPFDIATQSDLPAALKPYISLMRFFSPQQLNPFDINPLRDILSAQIDFERLKQDGKIKLFIATTRVSTGTLRLFRNKQLSLDVLLASACLPMLHRSIEIEGEAYWDGGLTANPPLFPLIHQCKAHDVLVVLLQPQPRVEVPTSASDIYHRLTEMGFSSTFYTEMQGVMLAKKEAASGWIAFGRLERRLRQLNMHVLESPELMSQLGMHSKMNAHPSFLKRLHDEGRNSAGSWLEQNVKHLGKRSSFRLAKLFS
ncbi:patatin-like phospholipase family protein [soil metagenome]